MTPAVCPNCGQRGDQRPGLRLEEFEALEAVFVNEEGPLLGAQLPQRLVCRSCGHAQAVARGSIDVRKDSNARPA